MLTDTHCHLNFESFDTDRELVLERAEAADVKRILIPGLDLSTSRAAVAFASSHPNVHAAIGIHPNSADTWTPESLDELRELAQNPKVVAIGEIGLDYYWEVTPDQLQRKLLEDQLELSAELGLPVVIHIRDKDFVQEPALQNTLEILGAWQSGVRMNCPDLAERPGVLHSFSGNLNSAELAGEYNFNIGITGPVTFKKSARLREVVAGVSEDQILIETDAPFLTPHPHRGERNEPAYVRFVAEMIAAVRKTNFIQIADVTTANAKRLFHW